MASFRHVLSLGYNCGAAYQVRLHTRQTEAHFFDWLYTSVDAARHVVETGGADVLARDKIEITRNGTELYDHGTGLRFNHSFKVNGIVDRNLIDTGHAREFAKFSYLAGKMRRVLAGPERVLFVRYNPYVGRSDNKDDVDGLVGALRARCANPEFEVLWVVNSPAAEPLKRLSDNLTLARIAEDRTRSSSLRGKDFIGTDDSAWGDLLGQFWIEPVGELLPKGGPVLTP